MNGFLFLIWILAAIPCIILSLILLVVCVFSFAVGFALVLWVKFIMPDAILAYVQKEMKK